MNKYYVVEEWKGPVVSFRIITPFGASAKTYQKDIADDIAEMAGKAFEAGKKNGHAERDKDGIECIVALRNMLRLGEVDKTLIALEHVAALWGF